MAQRRRRDQQVQIRDEVTTPPQRRPGLGEAFGGLVIRDGRAVSTDEMPKRLEPRLRVGGAKRSFVQLGDAEPARKDPVTGEPLDRCDDVGVSREHVDVPVGVEEIRH